MDHPPRVGPYFEVLEHTADVGIRAVGPTLEETFEQATLGMLDIAGISGPRGTGGTLRILVEAGDLGALLVEWLSEILYLHDSRTASIADVELESVGPGSAMGTVALGPLDQESEGTQVKAVTYHRLRVERTQSGWEAELYLDI